MSECDGATCTHPDCLARRDTDPVVKYDGLGRPVLASDPSLGNRAQRRELARQARRRR